MLKGNLSLVTTRMYRGDRFTSVLASRYLVEMKTAEFTRGTYCFPLYLYDKKKEKKRLKGGGSVINLTLFESGPGYSIRQPNLAPAFVAAVKEKLGLDFVQEGKGNIGQAQGIAPTTFGPEDVFCYVYAILHSPTYRERYAEFLKIDFPRIPLTSDREQFKALVEKGGELVALHLMESPALNPLITGFPVAGSDEVRKIPSDRWR
jgi:predicted helicase